MNEGTESSQLEAPTETLSSPATTEIPPPPPEPVAPPPAGKGRRRLFVLIGAMLAVAIIASIAAVALSGGGGKPAGKASPKGSPSPLRLIAPVGLSATPEAFSVTLSWAQPTGGAEIGGYAIYRNGLRVGEIAAGSTSFTDLFVAPGKDYLYQVEAKGKDGVTVTDRVSASATTPILGPSAARIAGDFDVHLRPKSQFGYKGQITPATGGWTFDPRCSEGACDVVMQDVDYRSLKATLHRHGARYRGTDGAKFGVTCRSRATVSTLTVVLRVVKAKAIEREWRATKLVGTLTQREPAQFGCVSSGVDWVFTATLLT